MPALLAAVLCAASVAAPRRDQANPDPVIAGLLSAGSTVLPLSVSAGLLLTGRGPDEGLRFDIAMGTLAVGSIAGPSIGQIYGRGGTDALITFLLRTVTGSAMTTGVGLRLRGNEAQQETGMALAIIGGIPTVFLAIWDIVGAARSAREVRYRASSGAAWVPITPELADVARCGPIPCGPLSLGAP